MSPKVQWREAASLEILLLDTLNLSQLHVDLSVGKKKKKSSRRTGRTHMDASTLVALTLGTAVTLERSDV